MAKTMKTHAWAAVRGRRSPEAEAAIADAVTGLRHAMRLEDIRKARSLTQATLAVTMDASQGEISKIERREDVYLSTLRRFIEAMGGELVVAARFPDGDWPIELGKTTAL